MKFAKNRLENILRKHGFLSIFIETIGKEIAR